MFCAVVLKWTGIEVPQCRAVNYRFRSVVNGVQVMQGAAQLLFKRLVLFFFYFVSRTDYIDVSTVR